MVLRWACQFGCVRPTININFSLWLHLISMTISFNCNFISKIKPYLDFLLRTRIANYIWIAIRSSPEKTYEKKRLVNSYWIYNQVESWHDWFAHGVKPTSKELTSIKKWMRLAIPTVSMFDTTAHGGGSFWVNLFLYQINRSSKIFSQKTNLVQKSPKIWSDRPNRRAYHIHCCSLLPALFLFYSFISRTNRDDHVQNKKR